MTTPTERSLGMLRKEGWTVGKTEHWNPHVPRPGGMGVRQDLLGFIDLVCFSGAGVLVVQTTSGSNAAARIAKIREIPAHAAVLASGARIEVHSWRKRGLRGKRKLWSCARMNVELAPTAPGWPPSEQPQQESISPV